jgi:adenylate kinase
MKNQNNKYFIYFNILLFTLALFLLYNYYLMESFASPILQRIHYRDEPSRDPLYLENNKKYCIIFIGPPYSGKSFYSRSIEKKLKLKIIDIGNILRKKIKNNDLDAENTNNIHSGKLLDDSIIFKIFLDEINKPDYENGFILDGFPRKISQAKLLEKILKKKNIKIKKIFYLKKDSDLIIKETLAKPRISNNVIRKDDLSISTIKKRLDDFYEKTKPLINYYNKINEDIIIINANIKRNSLDGIF